MKDIDKYVAEKAKEAWEKWRISVDVGDFIRTIVEECKPKVSRKFVEKYYEEIRKAIGRSAFTLPIRILIKMLEEADVEVEK